MTNIRGKKLAAAIALAFLLATVFPAAILADSYYPIYLHQPHEGANSETFNEETDAGGLTDPVVWHFVLNQLDGEDEPILLEVEFLNSVSQGVYGQPVGNGSLQHFYVGTADHDILLGAVAFAQTEGAKLVLSHVVIGEIDDENGDDENGDDENGDDENGDDENGDEVVAGDTGGRGGAPPAVQVEEEEVANIPEDEVPLVIPEEEPIVEIKEEAAIEEEVIIEEEEVALALPKTGDAAAGLIGIPFLLTLAGYGFAKKW